MKFTMVRSEVVYGRVIYKWMTLIQLGLVQIVSESLSVIEVDA
jgi:hypothetical protein